MISLSNRINRKKFIQFPIERKFFTISCHNLFKGGWNDIKNYFGNRCVYCGKITELTRDHIIAKSNFAKKHPDTEFYNLVPACFDCNHDKDDKSFFEFVFIEKSLEKGRVIKI